MYNDYAKYFDKIFPASNSTVDFLDMHFIGTTVLDIGCGSGEYTNALFNKGYNVTGIDLDSEMITYAKQKNSAIPFHVENMLAMNDKKYDNLYCIGNTLVHLPTKEAIQLFLNKCFHKLNDGSLILQIINYDRIIDQNITSLPTIENADITFKRNYILSNDKVTFSTILTTSKHTYHNSVDLIPLQKKELEEYLHIAGFKSITCYDGFSNTLYHKNSYALVVEAKKL